jgi:predicted Zn-dependent protease
MTDQYGEAVHQYYRPVVLILSTSVPDKYVPAITRAVNRYNAISMNLFMIASVPTSSAQPAIDRLNVIYWYTSAWPSISSQQALTRSQGANSMQIDADILINNQYMQFYVDTYEYGMYHLESIMIHELGHVLGIVHSNEFNSVMYPYLDIGQERVNFTQQDINAIKCYY